MKKRFVILLLALSFLAVTGCTNQNSSQSSSVSTVAAKKKTHNKKTVKTHKHKKVVKTKKQTQTNLQIKIGKKTLKAHLNNSSAAKAFAKELPKTMKFWTFGSMPEKVADLHHTLPTQGMPSGSRGKKGYIGYWSPDRRIVFYYGNEEYWEGIHLIGKFDSKNYAKIIKNAPENVQVKISKVK